MGFQGCLPPHNFTDYEAVNESSGFAAFGFRVAVYFCQHKLLILLAKMIVSVFYKLLFRLCLNVSQSGFNRLSELSMQIESVFYCIVSRVFAKVHGLFVRAIMFQIRRSFKLMLASLTLT
jgi:hypothetical protein